MCATDSKQLGNTFICFSLFKVAQIISRHAVEKMQRLSLRTHARTIIANKTPFERDVAGPVIQQFFNCGWVCHEGKVSSVVWEAQLGFLDVTQQYIKLADNDGFGRRGQRLGFGGGVVRWWSFRLVENVMGVDGEGKRCPHVLADPVGGTGGFLDSRRAK